MQKPSIGRIILFTPANSPGGSIGEPAELDERPAMITKVHSERVVDLVAFGACGAGYPGDGTVVQGFASVELSEDDPPRTYHWRWPPRV